MNCIYLKQKLNHTLVCKKEKCTITLKDCANCKYKEYKNKTNCQIFKEKRQKSKKLTKLERNRFSVFTEDLDHCIICGSKRDNLHEIFFGKNRIKSMELGFVIPLCYEHHMGMHKYHEWQENWHEKGQLYYEEHLGSRDDFIREFGKSYLK